MFAAAHLDNFLFLIFFAIAIIFQLLTRLANKSGKRPGSDQKRRSTLPRQTPRPASRQLEETDEDRVRKFLEALGQPPTSTPPPPARPRTDVPPRPVAPIQPPPEMRSFSIPVRELIQEQRRKRAVISEKAQLPTESAPTRERTVFTPRPEIPAFQVHSGPPPLAPITESEVAAPALQAPAPPSISQPESITGVAALLRSTPGLRDAIILREIFGPPRSLQPLDLVENA